MPGIWFQVNQVTRFSLHGVFRSSFLQKNGHCWVDWLSTSCSILFHPVFPVPLSPHESTWWCTLHKPPGSQGGKAARGCWVGTWTCWSFHRGTRVQQVPGPATLCEKIYELFRLFNKTVITIIGLSPEKSGPSRINPDNPGISLPEMRNLWSRLGLQQQSSSKRTLVQTSQQPQDLKTCWNAAEWGVPWSSTCVNGSRCFKMNQDGSKCFKKHSHQLHPGFAINLSRCLNQWSARKVCQTPW